MNKVYVIAEEISVVEDGDYTLETRVLHLLGAWSDEAKAKLKCLELNARRLPEDDSATEDKYFVLAIEIK